MLLIYICAALQVWWILEQPKGSLMEYHPLFQQVLRVTDVFKLFTRMRDFGHGSEKPTWLYSSLKTQRAQVLGFRVGFRV